MIRSPYDAEARYATKRTTFWTGYKAHLTETCDDDRPRLIIQVETAAGPIADGAATPTIHHDLATKDLLPSVHIVDTAYLDAALLVDSRDDYDEVGRSASNIACCNNAHEYEARRYYRFDL